MTLGLGKCLVTGPFGPWHVTLPSWTVHCEVARNPIGTSSAESRVPISCLAPDTWYLGKAGVTLGSAVWTGAIPPTPALPGSKEALLMSSGFPSVLEESLRSPLGASQHKT